MLQQDQRTILFIKSEHHSWQGFYILLSNKVQFVISYSFFLDLIHIPRTDN